MIAKKCSTCRFTELQGDQYPCCDCIDDFEKWEEDLSLAEIISLEAKVKQLQIAKDHYKSHYERAQALMQDAWGKFYEVIGISKSEMRPRLAYPRQMIEFLAKHINKSSIKRFCKELED